MQNNNPTWSDTDIQFLKENYEKFPTDLVFELKRPWQEIFDKMKELGLTKRSVVDNAGKPWSEEDVEFLKKNYQKRNTDLMLYFGRPYHEIFEKKKELGLLYMPANSVAILALADMAHAKAIEMKKKAEDANNPASLYNKYYKFYNEIYLKLSMHPVQADLQIRLKTKLQAILAKNNLCATIIHNFSTQIAYGHL